jgi:hypothetical protein
MGKLRSSRGSRESGAFHIRSRLVFAASLVSFACGLRVQVSGADTSATWTSETSDDWTSAIEWSTNPNYPNNGTPAGASYQALINAIGGTPYTILLDSNIDLNALTLDSADATLSQTSGDLEAGTINLDAGSYQLEGGSIASSTINLNGGSLNVQTGMLSDVTVTGGDLQVGGVLRVQNGLTITNHNLDLGSPASVFFDGPSQNVDNLNITSSVASFYEPSIYLSGPNSVGPQTLTLGNNVIVHGGVVFYSYHNGDTLVNNGSLLAGTGGGIEISGDNFTNNETVEATNGQTVGIDDVIGGNWNNSATGVIGADGSTLSLGSNWTNAGTINVTNSSTAILYGNFTTAGIGNFNVDSTSTVNISGTVINTGTTLAFSRASAFSLGSQGGFISPVPPYGSPSPAYAATIIGGTIDNSADNFSVGGDSMLNGVTITGGDLKVYGTLYVQNGLTIANHNLDVAVGSSLFFDGPGQSLDSINVTGNVGSGAAANIYAGGPDSSGPQTLTLGSNITVHGVMNILSYQTGDTLVNSGTINADAAYNFRTPDRLTISVDNFVNNGIIETNNNGELSINSSNFVNHGTIELHGGEIFSPASSLNVGDGTLEGSGDIIENSSVTLSDASTLEFQLRSDTDYDSLGIPFGLSLDGDLEVTLANGFMPTISDSFTVLNSSPFMIFLNDELTGSFSNVVDGGTLETADGSGYFKVYYADAAYPNEIVLTDFQPGSVPEPTCVALFGVSSISLLVRRRRAPDREIKTHTSVLGRINRSSVGVSSTITSSAIYGPTATDA